MAVSTFRLKKNKNILSGLSYKIYSCTNKLNFNRLENVKKDLYLVNQKLFLIDLLVNKDNYEEKIVKQAENFYEKLIVANTPEEKTIVFNKVNEFIKTIEN